MPKPTGVAGSSLLTMLLTTLLAGSSAARELPSVASINLCTDQLVLRLADDEQILTLSWLSADPHESMLAEEARRFAPNYGSAEEILRLDPDVVIAGSFTNGPTRALLRELGMTVVDVPPAEGVEGIEANLLTVAAAIGQQPRAETLIGRMRARLARLRAARPEPAVAAVALRPGGFTVERPSLAHELMTLAGLRNVAAEQGLDRWGSLSVETLVRAAPELMILADYRRDDASLANTVFDHPALGALSAGTTTVTVPSSQWGCGLPDSLDSVETMQRAAREALGRRDARSATAEAPASAPAGARRAASPARPGRGPSETPGSRSSAAPAPGA